MWSQYDKDTVLAEESDYQKFYNGHGSLEDFI